MKKLVLALISGYQKFISPLLPKTCCYYPTCSHYAKWSISSKGVFNGTLGAVSRILRCHQLHPGGWDPVKE